MMFILLLRGACVFWFFFFCISLSFTPQMSALLSQPSQGPGSELFLHRGSIVWPNYVVYSDFVFNMILSQITNSSVIPQLYLYYDCLKRSITSYWLRGSDYLSDLLEKHLSSF